MGKTAVMTDSNSGMTQEEAKAYGIYVLPMPIYLDDVMYYEGQTITREMFFDRQEADAKIHTSQPLMGNLMDSWNELLKTYEELVFLPMSSSLSGACEAAMLLAQEYEGRVEVVDNRQISVTLKYAALDAAALAAEGRPASEIKAYLEANADGSSIYITVDTLKYLKRGGRITPAAAALGTVLQVKPVLTIQGGKLDAFAKVRGLKAAKKRIISAIEADIAGRFAQCSEEELVLGAAYTCSEEEALVWKAQLEEHFGRPCEMDPLSLSIACHTGPGAVAAGLVRKYRKGMH